MINFIPIFPLQIVVFPGEPLNLHIFEPRYKQLINDCFALKKPFGIPVVLNGSVKDYGCLMHIKEISHKYDNGEMDIKTEGEKVFRILEMIQNVPDKLYAGAIVDYPENNTQGKPDVMKLLINKMKNFHESIQVKKDFLKPYLELSTYDIAHHSGLTVEQEYEFMQLLHERQRQEYLKRHFENHAALVQNTKSLKEKIQMNGQFRSLQSP